jgi:hypothetical protein
MGGLSFRAGHSWTAAALAMALIPLIALDVSPAWAGQQMLEVRVAAFLTDPPEILRESPKGGVRLMVDVRELVLADPTTLQSILALVPQANKAQNAAIGAGLAQAARVSARTRPGYAKEIQQAVMHTQDQDLILAYDAAVATGGREGRVAEGAQLPQPYGAPAGTAVGPSTTTVPSSEGTITLVSPPIVVPGPGEVPTPALVPPPVSVAPPGVSTSSVVPSLGVLLPTIPSVAALPQTVEPTIPAISTVEATIPAISTVEATIPVVPAVEATIPAISVSIPPAPVVVSTPSPLVLPVTSVVPTPSPLVVPTSSGVVTAAISPLAVEPQTSISRAVSPSQ